MDVERHRLCDRWRPCAGAEVGGLGRDCIIPPAIKAPHTRSHFHSSSSHRTSPCFSSSFLLPFHCFSLLFAFAFLFFCIYIFIFPSLWSSIRGTQHRAAPLVIPVEIPLTHRQHQRTDDHQGGHVPNTETCNSCFSSLLGRGHLGHADHGWLNTISLSLCQLLQSPIQGGRGPASLERRPGSRPPAAFRSLPGAFPGLRHLLRHICYSCPRGISN